MVVNLGGRGRPIGGRDQEGRLGAELRTPRPRLGRRKLAASLGPHHKMPQDSMPVKGLVSLGSDTVCSRAARNPFTPPIPKPDTVALSAAPRLDAGGEDGPASSIGGLPTVGQNARLRTASIGLVGLNAYGQRQPRPALSRRRTRRPSVRSSRARASASNRIRFFLLRSSRVRRAFRTPPPQLFPAVLQPFLPSGLAPGHRARTAMAEAGL